MHCFVHHDQEAVGVCRACGKGLCPDCTVDLGHSISCRGACEQEAQEIRAQILSNRAILKRNQAIMNAQKKNRFLMPAFCIAIGALFEWFSFSARDPFNRGAVLGAFFIVFGLVLLIQQRRYFKTIDRTPLK